VLIPFCQPVPQDAYACALFTYQGNIVAIDLVGAAAPLLASVMLVSISFLRGSRTLRLGRITTYFVLMVTLGAATAGEFMGFDAIFGGISVDTRLLIYTVLVPFGIAQFVLLDRSLKPNLSIPQCYSVGVLGLILSDIFRTFSGTLNVSPLIIGGSGPYDAVFLGPLFMVIGYLFGATGYVVYRRRKEGIPQNT
jgi:hypothetical protein